MLGGRRSFAEGGWAGTPVAEVLPVVHRRRTRGTAAPYFSAAHGAADARRRDVPGHADRRRPKTASTREVERHAGGDARSTRSARSSPARRCCSTGADNRPAGAGRARVPALRPRQGARVADPGLVALADGRDDAGRPTRRTRRSGGGWSAGSSTACPTRSTLDDGARSRRAGRADEADGRGRSTRRSPRSTTRTSSRTVTSPSGKTTEVPLEWTVTHDGEYRASVRARRSRALRRSRSTATRDQKDLGIGDDARARRRPATASTSTPRCARRCSSASPRKPAAASSRRPNAASLPEAISYSGRGVTVVEERDLWDMPIAAAAAARPRSAPSGATAASGGSRDRGVERSGLGARRPRLVAALRRWSLLAVLRAARAPAAAQDTHLLVITGVGGDEEHATQFHKWATAIVDAAKKRRRARRQHHLSRREARAATRRASAAARRARTSTKAFADLAARAQAERRGLRRCSSATAASTARQAAFNLPGPDLTAADYAQLLDKFADAARRRSSTRRARAARSCRPLAGPGRTIVTATKTGGERNETRFPRVSSSRRSTTRRPTAIATAACRCSKRSSTRRRRSQASTSRTGHILTEHATLDDGGEGKLAATLFLESRARRRGRRRATSTDPALRALLEEQRRARAADRRAAGCRKTSMDPARVRRSSSRSC